MVKVAQELTERVSAGDAVIIPAGAPQQVSNIGENDLLFYCICTPRFSPECYESLEP
jgi:mannose-6-phosphate isomerase-like protein (cupin superfamily)